MSLIFSKSCEYAIQATLFLAAKQTSTPILLRDISDALSIPHHFLSKIFQQLTREHILESHKGSSGGFELSRPPNQITLHDIIRAVDGGEFLSNCVLGFPQCGDDNPCPVHDQWKNAKAMILAMVDMKTIRELSKELDGKLNLIDHLRKTQ
ncbi:MAG: Rrf2 family transcriptional regulator [Ignavibacteriales bacterium]|nr:Rrf2 family transcriptional regulator [Ignavibacteriales bacterium]